MNALVVCLVFSGVFNLCFVLLYCGMSLFYFRHYSLTDRPYVLVRHPNRITRNILALRRPFQDFGGSNICKYFFILLSFSAILTFLDSGSGGYGGRGGDVGSYNTVVNYNTVLVQAATNGKISVLYFLLFSLILNPFRSRFPLTPLDQHILTKCALYSNIQI